MKRSLGLCVLVLAISGAAAGSAQTPSAKPLVVKKAPLECLVAKIDKQRLGMRRTMRVNVQDCNIEDASGAAPKPPTEFIPLPRFERQLPVETVLELDAASIDCIKRNRRRITNFARPIGNYYLIDIRTCRAPAL